MIHLHKGCSLPTEGQVIAIVCNLAFRHKKPRVDDAAKPFSWYYLISPTTRNLCDGRRSACTVRHILPVAGFTDVIRYSSAGLVPMVLDRQRPEVPSLVLCTWTYAQQRGLEAARDWVQTGIGCAWGARSQSSRDE